MPKYYSIKKNTRNSGVGFRNASVNYVQTGTKRFAPPIKRPLSDYDNISYYDDMRYWKIHCDKRGRSCIGFLYPGHDYRNVSIMLISLYSQLCFLLAYPIIEYQNDIFGFVNDAKCLFCKKIMKVYIKFIDHKTSYMFDIKNTCEKVYVRIKNRDVALAHSTCLIEKGTKKYHTVLFAIKEQRMSFLKYWWREMQKRSLKDAFIIVPVVYFIIKFLVHLAPMLYAIISMFMDLDIEPHIVLNCIVIIVTVCLCLCAFIYMRKLYLNDLNANGRAMILELRKIDDEIRRAL